jgi:hypothetical protein
MKTHHNKVRKILADYEATRTTKPLEWGAEDKACEELDRLFGELFLERFEKEIAGWLEDALTSSEITVLEAARRAARWL